MTSTPDPCRSQEYVDNQLINEANFSSAAILGLDGSIWAQSKEFPELQKNEAVTLISNMSSMDVLHGSGICVGGHKYIFISGEEGKICRGKFKDVGSVIVSKTDQTLIIGICGDDTATMINCSERVDRLGDYLRGQGY
ncbi:hypothetical protein H632_c1513p1 [Helicosporidium sp. ATCC 50920]|nr:hypothetical protein H632_c1513p1 [Helicosporidium sp. ATCC 50920]|eukprot:KDD74171.1 hypothetical protein H632_c1513p1 [Helicosporidium sp. ATCC 50920]